MNAARFATILVVVALYGACGTSKKPPEETPTTSTPTEEAPRATPSSAPATAATTQPAVPPPPTATIWVASNTLRAVAGYDANGSFMKSIDLSTYLPTGSITSITFLNKNTMIVTADPGAAGEKLMRIDLADEGGTVSGINANWFQDSVNFNNISMYKILKWSNSKLIATKGNAMFEMLTYNASNNAVSRTGIPAIGSPLTTGANICNITAAQYVTTATLSNVTKLIGFSSGASARANIYGNINSTPTCDGTFNYVAGSVSSSHIPVGAVQMADGKIYVRYQFTTNPLIMRYTYDGLTLTNGSVFFNDSGFLNTSTADRDLVALDGTNLLFTNWQANSIVKLNITSGVAEFLIRDMFTASANAIAVRPAQ